IVGNGVSRDEYREVPRSEIDSLPTERTPELDADARRAVETIRRALEAMLGVVVANEDEWGRLDAVAGDGDHGVGMARGAHGAVQGAAECDGGPRSVLQAAADAFADRAGGSSGALWGAFLGGVAALLPDDRCPDDGEVSAAMTAGADALQRLGKCEIGDKTMYDALRPFTDELAGGVAAGQKVGESWRAAASVASARSAATADLMPLLGRARPLGKRSLGTPDPGATSLAACLEAVAPVVADALGESEE
ncbi:MAG: DAK2 domain-containing protein, partial [Acidimicrobiia bacterium]|nr:DAK2 domain-containing protein [Acidimicrobiia bacterium]